MKSIVIVVAAVVVLSCFNNCSAGTVNRQLSKRDTMADQWEEYKTKFNKSYPDPEEDKRRFELYKTNVAAVEAHNEKYKKGEVTWEMGINHFSDLTPEELKSHHGVRQPFPVKEQ